MIIKKIVVCVGLYCCYGGCICFCVSKVSLLRSMYVCMLDVLVHLGIVYYLVDKKWDRSLDHVVELSASEFVKASIRNRHYYKSDVDTVKFNTGVGRKNYRCYRVDDANKFYLSSMRFFNYELANLSKQSFILLKSGCGCGSVDVGLDDLSKLHSECLKKRLVSVKVLDLRSHLELSLKFINNFAKDYEQFKKLNFDLVLGELVDNAKAQSNYFNDVLGRFSNLERFIFVCLDNF